jgi:hypothetical protein
MKKSSNTLICENCGNFRGKKYYPPDNSLNENEREEYSLILCRKCSIKLGILYSSKRE